jgi:glyoxylate reductase
MSDGYDGLLTSLTDKMDKETINKLPESVKVISNFAVGFGNIDLDAAKKKGIAVTNTPEVLSDATAEIGILLILGACRRAAEGIESAKEGGWKWSADYLIGKQLTGTRLGVLGMGRIGQKIARIAKSLGMIIHYHNRSKLAAVKENGAIYHDSLKSLFSVSDVLSICCPATKETENMINKETVEYFPKGAVITNVARGDIVDDEALIDALNRRKIYAAGLDVYKNEPNLHPGYLKIKSAFILPHLGSATKDTRIAMANLAIDNLDEFFKTGNCKNKVN